jgi:hypothetical protein
MPYFAGRVKCFAIDGPYNTRSAFEHYDDNLEHSTLQHRDCISSIQSRHSDPRPMLFRSDAVVTC